MLTGLPWLAKQAPPARSGTSESLKNVKFAKLPTGIASVSVAKPKSISLQFNTRCMNQVEKAFKQLQFEVQCCVLGRLSLVEHAAINIREHDWPNHWPGQHKSPLKVSHIWAKVARLQQLVGQEQASTDRGLKLLSWSQKKPGETGPASGKSTKRHCSGPRKESSGPFMQ